MKAPSFRLYKYVDQRFQFMGLKVEEVSIVFFGLLLFFVLEDMLNKTLCLVFMVLSFVFLRKISKKIRGFSFASYMNWYFGVSPRLGDKFPRASTRRIVGE